MLSSMPWERFRGSHTAPQPSKTQCHPCHELDSAQHGEDYLLVNAVCCSTCAFLTDNCFRWQTRHVSTALTAYVAVLSASLTDKGPSIVVPKPPFQHHGHLPGRQSAAQPGVGRGRLYDRGGHVIACFKRWFCADQRFSSTVARLCRRQLPHRGGDAGIVQRSIAHSLWCSRALRLSLLALTVGFLIPPVVADDCRR